MRKTVAVLAAGVLGATAVPAAAQAQAPDTTALRNAVTRAEILRYEQRLNAIGLANENTRLTASTGNWETVNFVVDQLRQIGYNPSVVPYVNASSPNTWAERTPPVLERTLADSTTKTYVNALNNTGDYSQMTWSRSGEVTAKVIPVARITVPPVGTADGTRAGCAMADFPAAVKDNIALVQRGGCTFLEKAINARANGAAAVLIMNEGQTNRTQPGTTTNGTTFTRVVGQTYPGLMAATLSYATGKEFYDAAQAGTPLTVHFKTDNNIVQRIDYDVVAETPGGDPNRVLQVGAHLDSVAAGPGINDDGSGIAMNLTIAHQILKSGTPLKYKIRFGWFSGEEQGLFGSQFFVNELNTQQTANTLAMLDYDMIASTNWLPFVYTDCDRSVAGNTCAPPNTEGVLGGHHIDYLKSKLNVDSVAYVFDNRSDYAQWRTRGVPATGLYTGAEGIKTAAQVTAYGGQSGIQADPCYHEWCDTVFNLSQFGMDEFSDVLADAIGSFAGFGGTAVELPVRTDN